MDKDTRFCFVLICILACLISVTGWCLKIITKEIKDLKAQLEITKVEASEMHEAIDQTKEDVQEQIDQIRDDFDEKTSEISDNLKSVKQVQSTTIKAFQRFQKECGETEDELREELKK